MDEPQAEQLVETLSTIMERPGQPVALIPRKRGISCGRASVPPSLIPGRYIVLPGGISSQQAARGALY